MLRKFKLWQWVLLALALGAPAGYLLGPAADSLKWMGDLFISLIMMVIAPLVFFSIVSGVISLGDPKLLGRMGLKAILGYVLTTAAGIVIALCIANIFQPGVGVPEELTAKLAFEESPFAQDINTERPTLVDILMGVVPNNAMQAMVERNILQVIFFAIVVGVVMVLIKDKTERVAQLVHEAAEIFYKIIELVILLAPIAVFGLTAWTVGVMGLDAVTTLSVFVFTVIFGCFVQYGVLMAVLAFFGRLNPLPFMKKSIGYQLIAFSTSSSSATLPTTMKVAQERLGVSNTTAAMIIPLGATVNMNGTAIYLAIAACFVAQLMNVPLSFEDYAIITTTITLVAVGTAAVPGGSIVMMPIVFSSVGIPMDAIVLILGVDRILDMVRTTLNVTGDAVVATVIDRSEKQLQEDVYYDPDT